METSKIKSMLESGLGLELEQKEDAYGERYFYNDRKMKISLVGGERLNYCYAEFYDDFETTYYIHQTNYVNEEVIVKFIEKVKGEMK